MNQRVVSRAHHERLLALVLVGATVLLTGCDKQKKPMQVPGTSFSSINLFGFEETQVHHIGNNVEHYGRVFLVRYDPKVPDNLEWVDCPVQVTYDYLPADGARTETIVIQSEAELRGKLPFSYMRYAGYIEAGSALNFQYVTVGSYEIDGNFEIPKQDSECAKATHYVTTLSVGAFSFAEERGGRAGASAETVAGIGGAAGASHQRGSSVTHGSLDACKEDDGRHGCKTPLQIMLRPLVSRHWRDGALEKPEVAPDGKPYPAEEGLPTPAVATEHALRVDETAWRPGHYMSRALEQLLVGIVKVQDEYSCGLDGDASAVGGGFINQGGMITMSRSLRGGIEYVLFGTGAVGADIDLHVLDPNGTVLSQDTSTDARPVVVWTPPADGVYAIVMTSPNADDFGAIAVMQKEGYRVPADLLHGVFQNLLDSGATASQYVSQQTGLSGLVFPAGTMALTGTILNPGEVIRTQVEHLEGQAAVFIGACHDASIDIDMSVTSPSNEKLEDVSQDSKPMVVLTTPDPAATYDVRLLYPSGTGTTLGASLALIAK